MTTDVTLGDLLATPTGQRMAAEVEAARQTKAADVEERRAANVATWQARLAELAPEYEALRVEALRALAELAPRLGRLVELRAQIRAFAGYVRKEGGEPDNCPEPMGPGELRRATDLARRILGEMGGGL